MKKNILDFTDIFGGWLNINVYDYMDSSVKKVRVSYIQSFFEDFLMGCRFLLSDITGIYEIYLDQEGYDGAIRFHKYNFNSFELEIVEDEFDDGTKGKTLLYFNTEITDFVENILTLIISKKGEYNKNFVYFPEDELDEELLEITQKEFKKYQEERSKE